MSNVKELGAQSTAAEVVQGVDLSGKVALVTGAASGIGVETARALASAGAQVWLAIRNPAAGASAAEDIQASTGNRLVKPLHLDLSDLASIDGVVAAWDGPLHIVVNNAGVMHTPLARTDQGWELQFATNHLGHFALARGLHDAMAAGGTARIVSVASSGHAASGIDFDDLMFVDRPYDPELAYGQSKTANVLFAVEATRRWAADGILTNACMPGGIFTNLQRHWDPDLLARTRRNAADVAKTPEQGAATSVLLATSPALAYVGGRYFEDCHEADVVDAITDGLHGVMRHALDPVIARRLWDVSVDLLDQARDHGRPGASS